MNLKNLFGKGKKKRDPNIVKSAQNILYAVESQGISVPNDKREEVLSAIEDQLEETINPYAEALKKAKKESDNLKVMIQEARKKYV